MWKILAWSHHFTKNVGFGTIKLAYPRYFLLKFLFKTRTMSSHVYIYMWCFSLLLWFFDYILKKNCSVVLFSFLVFHFSTCTIDHYIENNTWQNPHHMPYHPEKPISSRGPLGPSDDIGRVLGWYGIWYGFCHVLYTLSYI